MTKKERKCNTYSLFTPKLSESEILSLAHGFVELVGLFTRRVPSKAHSLLELTMIDPAISVGWFEIVQATNKSATSIQDLFHDTWLAHFP
jgi:hypothetical protein